MNNMIWDAVLWLRKKLNRDKEDIITAVNNIQNLFETSADATASPSDILAGKTAYNGTVLLTGSMKDRRGMTVTSGTVTQDDEYTYLTVPEEACFNASSKLRTKNSNIKSFVQTQLQAGSVLGTNCEQKYLNSGYSTLFASIIAINVSGSNDDVNYANIGMLSTTQNIVSIKNYKYIKLTCYNANGYGKKATWSIQVS